MGDDGIRRLKMYRPNENRINYSFFSNLYTIHNKILSEERTGVGVQNFNCRMKGITT
jgi:hypothetical protein